MASPASVSASASSAPAAPAAPSASETRRLLADRFAAKKKALHAEETGSAIFNMASTRPYNLMTADGAVTDWTTKEALRELITNWWDEVMRSAADIGCAGVTTRVTASPRPTKFVLEPGSGEVDVVVEWQCTVDISGIEIGSIMFVREPTSWCLHGFLRNRLACMNVLKVFGYGFSTKAGDSTQSGRFGDGLKSAAAVLVRECGEMALVAKGRKWTFRFVRDAVATTDHQWLMVEKTSTNSAGKRISGDDAKDVMFHLSWDGSTQIRNVFEPDNYLAFSDGDSMDMLHLDDKGSERILFDKKHHGKLYVKGVFVCRVNDFHTFGFDSTELKAHMNRDRSSISGWDASNLLAVNVANFLDDGGDPARIYNMVNNAIGFGFGWNLQNIRGAKWRRALAREFTRLHSDSAYPFHAAPDRTLIERELNLTAIKVSKCLYDALCKSKVFLRVSAAVTRAFATNGRQIEWPSGSRVMECVSAMRDELRRMDVKDIGAIDAQLRAVKSKFDVRVDDGNGDDVTIYLRWSVVRKLERGARNTSKIRALLYDIYEALSDHGALSLSTADARRFPRRIADFAEGSFGAAAATSSEEECSDSDGSMSSAAEDDDDDDCGDSASSAAPTPRKRPASDLRDNSGDSSDNDRRDTKRARPADASDGEEEEGGWTPPPSFGTRFGDPHVESVESALHTSVVDPGSPEPHEHAPPPCQKIEHTHDVSLVADSHTEVATFYRTPATDVDGTLFAKVAETVWPLLRDVFGWPSDVRFGVYFDNSNTMAFTRGGRQLYINARYHSANGAEARTHYFHVICHEVVHMHGFGAHDEAFASALYSVGVKYQEAFCDYIREKRPEDVAPIGYA